MLYLHELVPGLLAGDLQTKLLYASAHKFKVHLDRFFNCNHRLAIKDLQVRTFTYRYLTIILCDAVTSYTLPEYRHNSGSAKESITLMSIYRKLLATTSILQVQDSFIH